MQQTDEQLLTEWAYGDPYRSGLNNPFLNDVRATKPQGTRYPGPALLGSLHPSTLEVQFQADRYPRLDQYSPPTWMDLKHRIRTEQLYNDVFLFHDERPQWRYLSSYEGPAPSRSLRYIKGFPGLRTNFSDDGY